jgi:hypothetical protein
VKNDEGEIISRKFASDKSAPNPKMNEKNALKPYGAMNFGNRIKGDLAKDVGLIEMKFPPLFRYYNNYETPNEFKGIEKGDDPPPITTLSVDGENPG